MTYDELYRGWTHAVNEADRLGKERDAARARVSVLEGRLARVCAYAERASFAECVKAERNPTTNEILGTTRFNRGGSVWSRSRRSRSGGAGK